MNKACFVLFLGLLAAVLTAACAGNGPSLGQQIATQECVDCHANLITCTKLGNDQGYWEKTVERMVDRGMEITTEEQQAVVRYLVGLEPGASPICD